MRSQASFPLTPWVRGIIIANTVVWILTITVFTGPWFVEFFSFSPGDAGSRWWGFVSYMFVHAGFLHLAFNMLMLFIFGPPVEERMGGGTFAVYYLICGLGGAAFSFALSLFTPVAPFVGASAAVFGVSLAYAMAWPDAPIYIFPLPLPIKAKWLVVFLATINLVLAITGAQDGVAHLAHLGGFLFGFIYLKSEAAVMRRARAALRTQHIAHVVPQRRVRETSAAPSAAANASATPLRQDEEHSRQDELDRVLDKISRSGLESLTPQERKLLDEVSRELRDDE